jgi:glycosyltransferase involved in cell wall biosynthesis
MNDKLVSIITPLYNGERFLAQTIESVLAQTYMEWEMLIINDGSTDKGEEVARAYAAKDKRIQVFSQPNAGSAAARNNGIRRARGRYIALLDADDLWEPDFLEQQLALLHDKQCQLVYGAHKRIDEDNHELLRPFVPPVKVTYKDILRTCSITCLTGLYDTVPYGKFYLREDFKSLRDDYVYWLEILRHSQVAYGNPHVVGSYRMRRDRITSSKRKMIIPQYKVYRQAEHLNVAQSAYYLCCWAWNGYRKYRR